MTTLTLRGLGPDKRSDMSESDTTNYVVPEPRASDGPLGPQAVRPPDRRNQHGWVPRVAALLCFLIGLSDVLGILYPTVHEHLRRINSYVPGTLSTVYHVSDVLIGLGLILLAHALRRRKRRAWQAVTALLTFEIVIHFMHTAHIPTAVVAIILLGTLLFYRDDFYAAGDPRTRWRALWFFGGLVVVDVAIGLTYIMLARGLASDYSFTQRVQDVIYGLVGVSGPVQFVPEARGDVFNILTTALGVFTLVVTAYLFLRPAEPAGRLGRGDADRIRDLLAKHGDRDSLGYFALRTDKSVIWSPPGSPASATAWSPASCSPAVTPSGIPRRGPERSRPSSTRRPGTRGRRRSWVAASLARRSGAGKAT